MKKFNWKEYFQFSKKERTAAISIAVIVSIITVTSLYIKRPTETTVTKSFTHLLNDSLKKLNSQNVGSSKAKSSSTKNYTLQASRLFEFDPNTLSKEGWQQLGLPEKNIQTIENYLSKGGHFWKAEDIFKIYGISKENARMLLPFIHIAHTQEKYIYTNVTNNTPKTYTQKPIQPIEINTATEEQWKTLPGIGNVLGKRIVKYRNSKGGFKSIDEVKNTYGLSDSTFNIIQPYLLFTENSTQKNDTVLQPKNLLSGKKEKININTASEQKMRNAQFLSISIIKAIIIYREQHSGFKSKDELKNIPFISDEVYDKIAPQLTIE